MNKIPVPAICNNKDCKAIFPTPIFLKYPGKLTNNGTIIANCPFCGSQGNVPNGEYQAFHDILFAHIFKESDVQLLLNITKTIKREIRRSKKPKGIKKKLKKQYPKYNNLWNLIPDMSKRDAFDVIHLILAITTVACGLHSCTSDKETTINSTYNNMYLNQNHPLPQNSPSDNHKTCLEKQDKLVQI